MATVLLAAGLCACEKADPVDPARLPGTWSKVYPEGVVTEGGVCWTFREDGVLHVRVYDVFSGNYETEEVYAKVATGVEGKVTWFEGDVTFRRSAGN